MIERPIQFYFRGGLRQIAGPAPTRTVLQYLREDLRQTGSKEGCAEGDCGACTVALGELDADGGLRLRAVNACIQFLPALDGKALFTVEDLADADGLHPLQQALIDHHGAQCGFCTPGFAMSLFARYHSQPDCPSRAELEDCLSGNLCRCTGYRPILDAAQAAWQAPRRQWDSAPVAAALRQLAALPPLHYRAADGGESFSPRSLAELAALRQQHPAARLVAGGTDVGLWVTKQGRALDRLIQLGAVTELKQIAEVDGQLEIGAAAPLHDAFAALSQWTPHWAELARRFASTPVKHAGTLGGNIANGSPIGDSMPALIALGATLRLQRGDVCRELALEDFYLAYQRTALAEGEFVRAVRVPRPLGEFRAYKVAKRHDQDISAVAAGMQVHTDAAGHVSLARLAYGGMAATPRRAAQAEAALLGAPWSAASVRAAMAALEGDFQPLSDARASADYRRHVAAQLLWRFWLDSQGQREHRLDALTPIGQEDC